jgi:phosphatidylethanolamine-binding protein (PEBP) family uncharacterized protein
VGSGGSSAGTGGSGASSGGAGGATSSGSGGTSATGSGGSGGTMRDASASGGGGTSGSTGSGGASGSSGGSDGGSTPPPGDASTGHSDGGATGFKITSPMVADGAMIPMDSTCETTKASSQMPELDWTGVPAGAKSFAMVFVDATLVGMTPPNTNGFHSAMWDIPGTVTMLPYGLPAGSPPAGVAGLETVKQKKAPSGMAWLGPCPNFGSTMRTKTDTYEFRLYALSQDMMPANFANMTIQQIMNAIEALPPLGKAVLTGTSNAAGTMLK